jgi:hypothetical protein
MQHAFETGRAVGNGVSDCQQAAAGGVMQHAFETGRAVGNGVSDCQQAAAPAQPSSVKGSTLCLQDLVRGGSTVPAAAGAMVPPATAAHLAAAASAMAAAVAAAVPNVKKESGC